jgi:hypothetical protein
MCQQEPSRASTPGSLEFDKDGNLWVGEQPVADLPDGGRVRVYLAADLAKLRGELRTLQKTLAMMTGSGTHKDPRRLFNRPQPDS